MSNLNKNDSYYYEDLVNLAAENMVELIEQDERLEEAERLLGKQYQTIINLEKENKELLDEIVVLEEQLNLSNEVYIQTSKALLLLLKFHDKESYKFEAIQKVFEAIQNVVNNSLNDVYKDFAPVDFINLINDILNEKQEVPVSEKEGESK